MSGKHSFRAFDRSTVTEEVRDEAPEAPEVEESAGAEVTESAAIEEDVVEAEITEPEATEAEDEDEPEPSDTARRRIPRSRVLVFAVLPALALLLAATSAFLKWQISDNRESATARTESVQAAKNIAVAMLSYEPDTVEQQLNSVRDRLTGEFLDTYTTLINTTIIPGATAQRITAYADVPAAGSVSASPDHAEVLLHLNQTVNIGDQAPQKTPSTVRATMERDNGRWLMSEFEPVRP